VRLAVIGMGKLGGRELNYASDVDVLFVHDGESAAAERLAREGGALVSPGDFYGAAGSEYVRVAVVQPDERIELMAERLGVGA